MDIDKRAEEDLKPLDSRNLPYKMRLVAALAWAEPMGLG